MLVQFSLESRCIVLSLSTLDFYLDTNIHYINYAWAITSRMFSIWEDLIISPYYREISLRNNLLFYSAILFHTVPTSNFIINIRFRYHWLKWKCKHIPWSVIWILKTHFLKSIYSKIREIYSFGIILKNFMRRARALCCLVIFTKIFTKRFSLKYYKQSKDSNSFSV